MKADVIVIGGGLAGALFAWTLRERGASVVVFDDRELSVCSRTAAGLYHPITGRRLALAWRAQTLLETGRRMFGVIEERRGRKVFNPMPIRRSFIDAEMVKTWTHRREQVDQAGIPVDEIRSDPSSPIRLEHGGYELSGCGYVNTAALLEAITVQMEIDGAWIREAVPTEKIRIKPVGVQYGRVEARHIVFAEGHLGRTNPYWSDLPFRPLHGEILDVRIKGELPVCIHLGRIFLIPLGNELWRAGATHNREIDRDEPTEAGREELEAELHAFLRLPFEVVGHRAGIRPASGDTMPFVGRHPQASPVWIFNGFGSRSLLLAPYCAERLAAFLLEGHPLPEAIDVSRFQKKLRPERSFRATRSAQDKIAEGLNPGQFAIDATAGNGHDTIWLAHQVGATGRILALDLQAGPLERTRKRLDHAGLIDRVSILQADHGELDRHLPDGWSGKVKAVMFNLGSLSRGERSIRTRSDTTLKGLETSLQALAPGGCLTVILSPGDPEGAEESRAIREWVAALPADDQRIEELRGPTPSPQAPWVLVLTKRRFDDQGTV